MGRSWVIMLNYIDKVVLGPSFVFMFGGLLSGEVVG